MSSTTPPEFIRLNGNAIRVTSWTALSDPGAFRLVSIVRGSADAALLADLLSRSPLDLEIPGEPQRIVYPNRLDRRDTGEPPATITRFSIDLSPNPPGGATDTGVDAPAETPSPITLEQRIAALETEVTALKALVRSLANDSH